MRATAAIGERRRGVFAPALALAIFFAFALGICLPGAPGEARAYAATTTGAQLSISPSYACEIPLSTAAVKKTYLTKKKMSVTMAGGDSTTIGVNKTGSKVRWTNSNKKVILVKPVGTYAVTVTALKPGKATITVKNSKQTLTCKVVVTGALNKRTVEMTPLQTSKLLLAGASVQRWTSSNASVVTVDGNGKLEPQSTGKATITCVDANNRKYTCSVFVKCPTITCSMKPAKSTKISGKRYYTRDFSLTNKSGKNIVLDNGKMTVYPQIRTLDKCNFRGFDLTTKAYLDTEPASVKNGAGYSFSAISVDSAALLSSKSFKMFFKAGQTHYCGAFYSTGVMFACRRMA